MRGRAFLDVARETAGGATEAHWRTAGVKAYYALLLECRDALARWGLSLPRNQTVHPAVRLRFTYATHPDVKQIGFTLDRLAGFRSKASYDRSPLALFASNAAAQDAVRVAT